MKWLSLIINLILAIPFTAWTIELIISNNRLKKQNDALVEADNELLEILKKDDKT